MILAKNAPDTQTRIEAHLSLHVGRAARFVLLMTKY